MSAAPATRRGGGLSLATRVPRILMGLSLLFAWASLSSVTRVSGLPHAYGPSAWLPLAPLTSGPGFALVSVVFAGACLAFVLGRRAPVAAALIVALLVLMSHLQSAQWAPDAHHANRAVVLPGAAMVAWWLARWRSRGQGVGAADAAGVEAACGITAACYSFAGWSKVSGSGLEWASGPNLAMHLMVHSYGSVEPLRALRQGLAELPALCAFFGHGTLLIECSFGLFLVPRLRRLYATAAVLMHLGIALVMGLHHYDWMLMVAGLGFSSPSTRGAASASGSPPGPGAG